MARIRKAIAAGLFAGAGSLVTAALAAWADGGPGINSGEWATIAGAALTVAVSAGLATWKVRNAGTAGGSVPVRPLR